jgi:hypothetical protein
VDIPTAEEEDKDKGKEEEEDLVHRQDITDILIINHLEVRECISEIRMEEEWVWAMDKAEGLGWACLEVGVHLGMEAMGKCS